MSRLPLLSRRTVLRGALGGAAVTVGLPPLEAMLGRGRSVFAADNPRRFLLFYWANGNIPSRWVPADEGPDWTPSEQLQPLASMRSKIAVVSGLDVKTGNIIPHFSGAAGILSGAPLVVRSRDDSTFQLPSVDQVIARELDAPTRFRSLELGVVPREGLSFSGPDHRNPPEPSPARAFERLFGAGFSLPGDDAPIDPTLALRRSVLDAVTDRIRSLSAQVGPEDQRRLDQHLTGVRELERRIARLEMSPPSLAACGRPDQPPASLEASSGRPPLEGLNSAMADLLAYAFACDQTRVASLWFSYPVHNLLYPEASAGHHQLTHDEPGDQPEVHDIVRFIMARLTDLLARLDGVEEDTGTLLDHAAVLATSDVSLGRTHSLVDMPVILAGRACGSLRTGMHLRTTPGENASRLLLSLCRIMGLRRASFGTGPGEVTEGLGDIEA